MLFLPLKMAFREEQGNRPGVGGGEERAGSRPHAHSQTPAPNLELQLPIVDGAMRAWAWHEPACESAWRRGAGLPDDVLGLGSTGMPQATLLQPGAHSVVSLAGAVQTWAAQATRLLDRWSTEYSHTASA